MNVVCLVLISALGAGSATGGAGRQFDFGRPFMFDSTVRMSPAEDGMHRPRVARADTVMLVVWDVDPEDVPYQEMLAIRITAGGRRLDSVPVRLIRGAWDKGEPAVAFDGTNFLVVWADGREGNGVMHLRGTFVTPQGIVLDTLGFRICPGDSAQTEPDLCFGGSNYLCVWTDNRNYPHTYGARITPAGQVLDPSGIFLNMQFADHWCYQPAVASDGMNYLVGWFDDDYDNIYGTRISDGGSVRDSSVIVFNDRSHYVSQPAITFGGYNYFAVWQDDHGILGARITPGGRNLDSFSIYVSPDENDYRPGVGFCDSLYCPVWSTYDGDRVKGARVALDGRVLDPTGIVIDSDLTEESGSVSVASVRNGFFAVWESPYARFVINGATINELGSVVNFGIARSYTANSQQASSVASNGEDFLAIWQDDREPAGLYGRRITSAGISPDSSAFDVSRTANYIYDHTVVAGNDNYLAAWVENQRGRYALQGRRIGFDGSVLDSQAIPICTLGYGPGFNTALSSSGTGYLAAWFNSNRVQAVRIGLDGRLLDSVPITVWPLNPNARNIGASFQGSNYLVAWGCYDTNDMIRAARITASGVLLDTVPIRIPVSYFGAYTISVAGSASQFLVSWVEEIDSMAVRAARILPSGVLVDSVPIVLGGQSSYELGPVLTFDGDRFVAAWALLDEIQGVRIDDFGQVSDPFTIAGDTELTLPALAANSHGEVLLSYTSRAMDRWQRSRVWGALNMWVGASEQSAPQIAGDFIRILPTIGRRFVIQYMLSADANASLRIYDRSGRKVRGLDIPQCSARRPQSFVWDGTDEHGRALAAGVYFIRMAARDRIPVQKVTIAE
jgi:large repetitive protein